MKRNAEVMELECKANFGKNNNEHCDSFSKDIQY